MSIAASARSSCELPSGFEQLYADHYDFVWRCALRLGATSWDVEDVVQETFVIALRRYDQTDFQRGGARPSTWLFAILHNVLRNHTRGERRRQARLDALEHNNPAVAQPHRSNAEATLALRLLDEFLCELEPDRRAVFVLAELEGMRGSEIASALELNHNTVRSRLRSARLAFEARFEQEREPMVATATEQRAPSEAQARGLALLAIGLDPLARPSAGAWMSWLTSARGLLTLSFGACSAVGLGWLISEREPTREDEPVRAELAAPAARTPAAELAIVDPQPEPEPEPAIVVELDEQRPSRTRPKPIVLDSDVALKRLSHAREALVAGDAAAALALVEGNYEWPATLDIRRVALEVGGLCALDQPERARARAKAWLAAHPDARSAVELRAVCWSDDNTSTSAGHQPSNQEQQ